MTTIDFNNTQIAFEYRSTRDLRKAKLLFSSLRYGKMVNFGSKLVLTLNKFKLAPLWLLKPFMFSHFCGGTMLEDAQNAAKRLADFGVKSIPDYSVEGKTDEQGIESVVEEIIRTMALASTDRNFAFSVFKPTALAPSYVLKKMSKKAPLTEEEIRISSLFHRRFERLCKMASHYKVRLLVDAEEYCFQDIIDQKTESMMKLYNKEKAIIFNTVQMYRHDREEYLQNLLKRSKEDSFHVGLKVVRGAYLEKENLLALQEHYPTPMQPNKEATDNSFNRAVEIIIDDIDRCELFLGTHNRESIEKLIKLMEQKQIATNDSRIVFSQLFGMSDNLSFNLAKANYNVAKYLPYGPLRETIPYLIRRAHENTSVAGQTSRELSMIIEELERRNSVRRGTKSQ